MKLTKLKLLNFRPFAEEHVFEFRDRFTVIAGVNGHGKTAILDALSILLSRLLPQVSPAAGGYKPLAPGDLYRGAESLAMVLSANCAGYPVTLSLTRGVNDRRARVAGLPRALKMTIREAYGHGAQRADDAAPIAVYYTTDRSGFRLPKKAPRAVPRGQSVAYYGALWDRRMDYRDLMSRLAVSVELEPERRGENPNFLGGRAVEIMNRVLGSFLEGFGGLRVEERGYQLVVDKNGIPLSIPQLSDGERSFLAMATDLCRRLTLANPRLDNPLEGKGVALIDELELHLHPTWQRDAVEKLRTTFPGIQFIVTTHSPFIVQSSRPGELISLDPTEFQQYANGSIEDIAKGVMGVDLPQKSERYRKMIEAASHYYELLESVPNLSAPELQDVKDKLDETAIAYSDDAAFVAFLKFQLGRRLPEDA